MLLQYRIIKEESFSLRISHDNHNFHEPKKCVFLLYPPLIQDESYSNSKSCLLSIVAFCSYMLVWVPKCLRKIEEMSHTFADVFRNRSRDTADNSLLFFALFGTPYHTHAHDIDCQLSCLTFTQHVIGIRSMRHFP